MRHICGDEQCGLEWLRAASSAIAVSLHADDEHVNVLTRCGRDKRRLSLNNPLSFLLPIYTHIHILTLTTMASNRVPTPPPLHDLPTAKEKKYDRQLRLWGTSGQAALEETHILLVNNGSGVTGIEALKNLVLPGIGQFSILDPAIVTEADLGVNFFLEDESLGKFRAEETVRLLEELNPDAKGTAIKEVSERIECAYTLQANADTPNSL